MVLYSRLKPLIAVYTETTLNRPEEWLTAPARVHPQSEWAFLLSS